MVSALFGAMSFWTVAEQTVAATLAWLFATEVIGHEDAFFAPIAAVISLNAEHGERARNVLRMLLGVCVGIFVGEITIVILGVGYGRLAVAMFVAMAIARALDASRIVIGQAAASAILTVVVLNGAEVGFERVTDALVGGGIALVFTQLLFTPEPVRLVRRAEAAGLAAIARTLDRTAHVLERDESAVPDREAQGMPMLHEQLIELDRAMKAGERVRSHSARWRSRARGQALKREIERARQLELLGGSTLMLARTAFATDPPARPLLTPRIRGLAEAIGDLAKRVDDRQVRRRAAARALALAQLVFERERRPESTLTAALVSLEIVAVDFMVFAGLPSSKIDAARSGFASRAGQPTPVVQ